MRFSRAGPHQFAETPHRPRRGYSRRKSSVPETPLVRWKFDVHDRHKQVVRGRCGGGEVSARKLAARFWLLRYSGLRSGSSHLFGYESESSLPYAKSTMEGSTKWDPGCSRISNDILSFYSLRKLVEEQASNSSVIYAVQAKLLQAHLCIRKLEAERQSSNKKVQRLLKKLGEERSSFQKEERLKIHAVVDDLKHELRKERKKCQRMGFLNSQLVNELANIKLTAKQFILNYEEEKEARELMEEVCNELAKKIGEDNAEVEALKLESLRICEEVEEESNMLQLAEVWREERVQMKLIDAKLSLEHKYSQMNKLITDLETFLRSGSARLNSTELRRGELILEAAKSMNIQDIKELRYMPPKPGDLYSVMKELHQVEASKTEVRPCLYNIPPSNVPGILSNDFINHNSTPTNATRSEKSSSSLEEQGSSSSLESEPSVN
ncbi:uncharacterized protein LOC120006665 isoform X2 [Tripterygium wilfordii]|uniref:uncharacterized protein LOC120006665 isoform X2 n=1 Tax=Tripterygium wilfordii TaxID=458696 RepID=UPI0018F8398A|nr:uncharacterized protein LOC120006665 isoform X2 [Tripterygium wilfordii]